MMLCYKDIVLKILSFLEFPDNLNALLICKTWYFWCIESKTFNLEQEVDYSSIADLSIFNNFTNIKLDNFKKDINLPRNLKKLHIPEKVYLGELIPFLPLGIEYLRLGKFSGRTHIKNLPKSINYFRFEGYRKTYDLSNNTHLTKLECFLYIRCKELFPPNSLTELIIWGTPKIEENNMSKMMSNLNNLKTLRIHKIDVKHVPLTLENLHVAILTNTSDSDTIFYNMTKIDIRHKNLCKRHLNYHFPNLKHIEHLMKMEDIGGYDILKLKSFRIYNTLHSCLNLNRNYVELQELEIGVYSRSCKYDNITINLENFPNLRGFKSLIDDCIVFGDHSKLERLNVQKDVNILCNVPNLKHLTILNVSNMTHFGGFTNLETFSIRYCTSSSLILPDNLKELIISKYNSAFITFPEKLKSLQIVEISKDIMIEYVPDNLVSLNVSFRVFQILKKFPSKLKNLKIIEDKYKGSDPMFQDTTRTIEMPQSLEDLEVSSPLKCEIKLSPNLKKLTLGEYSEPKINNVPNSLSFVVKWTKPYEYFFLKKKNDVFLMQESHQEKMKIIEDREKTYLEDLLFDLNNK